jgi:hypothetical protein
MKPLLCILLLCAVMIRADEASDRQAITGVIATLNAGAIDAATLLDSEIAADELRAVFQLSSSVRISHEPWGEATVDRPAGKIVCEMVRLITPDVALADGAVVRAGEPSTPILFVMKRLGSTWKIASVRVLASR